ncbi:hypothetical protein ACFQ2B_34645 [Streptomyces stramineus]|uniref:hypothetical protein n=1 Tax=Streptomyces TaxID=1883 RepID=UPI00340735C0
MHLASALQMAGFPHVIGSLWPVDDAESLQRARAFSTDPHSSSDPARGPAPRGARRPHRAPSRTLALGGACPQRRLSTTVKGQLAMDNGGLRCRTVCLVWAYSRAWPSKERTRATDH